VAPSAVGSLTADLGPGALVVPDQVVDRTRGRAHTFYDVGGAVHVGLADQNCPVGRSVAVAAAGAGSAGLPGPNTSNSPRASTSATAATAPRNGLCGEVWSAWHGRAYGAF